MAQDNPLRALTALGQSVWLDDIRRRWLDDGTLARWIAEDALAGITSNPAIFEKAIAENREYDEAISAMAGHGLDANAIYETLVLEDVGHAADLFRPVYDRTDRRDGMVSIEVSPHLAHDTKGTISEAQRLWEKLQRPNVMIKVPATRAGLPAIRQLIAQGINVNVTLLFGLARYHEVALTYIKGLESRARAGAPLAGVESVASIFLSRIDALIDRRLDALGGETTYLRGKAAIDCARLAYQSYKATFAGQRWRALAAQGARPQRLLWASTSTKDPAYSDILYVDALIAPETVTTLPLATLNAYRAHGQPHLGLQDGSAEAQAFQHVLHDTGIDLQKVGEQLEAEGVQKFIDAYDGLLATLVRRTAELKAPA
jgi:transaldolase